jgi:hypothetical protein
MDGNKKDETPAEKKLREELAKAAEQVKPEPALGKIRQRTAAKKPKPGKKRGEK